jgi:hypothetical protein
MDINRNRNQHEHNTIIATIVNFTILYWLPMSYHSQKGSHEDWSAEPKLKNTVQMISMDSYGLLRIPTDPYGFLWIPMDSYGFLRIPKDSYGFGQLRALHVASQVRQLPIIQGLQLVPRHLLLADALEPHFLLG